MTDQHLQQMFKILDNKINILGDNRRPLLEQFPIAKDDVYNLFLKSVTLELFNLGGSNLTYIELRSCHLTVTNGDYTMEITWPCPPFCN